MPRVLREAEELKVLKAADYPPETHQFILDLMRAFQLCYASEEEQGKPERYLVPELLPEFEPEMTELWEHALVRLRYRYEVLPPGLLPRFIVRTHALSDGAPHWRHGVVLRHVTLRRRRSSAPRRIGRSCMLSYSAVMTRRAACWWRWCAVNWNRCTAS